MHNKKILIGCIVGGALALIIYNIFILKKIDVGYILGGIVGIFFGYKTIQWMEKKDFYNRLVIFTKGAKCQRCKKYRKNIWSNGKWRCPKCELHLVDK